MGNEGNYRALTIYEEEKIYGLLSLLENKYPQEQLLNSQECLMCNFLKEEEILLINKALIKDLGLTFDDLWTSFEVFEKGYEPTYLNIEQVKLMTELLEVFYQMFKVYMDGKVKVDFDHGKIMTCFRSTKTKELVMEEGPLMTPSRQLKPYELKKDYSKKLKKCKRKNMEIEYEFLNYLPIKIMTNIDEKGRTLYPRLRAFARREPKFMYPTKLTDKRNYKSEEEYIDECIDALASFFKNEGIPNTIYVRDEQSKLYLKQIAKKADINIVVSGYLEVIDTFYNGVFQDEVF